MKLKSLMSLAAGMLVGLFACLPAQAVLHSPETGGSGTDFTIDYTKPVVPKYTKDSYGLCLYPNAKLSTVTGISADYFLLHTNFMLPYWQEASGNIDGTDQDGVYHYHYEKTDTEEYALCQFQGRFRNSYLIVLTLKLTQVGTGIYAQVVGTSYPYSSKEGSNQETVGKWNPTYLETLADIKTTGGQTRTCLANVILDFADPDLKMTVTYQDEDGNLLGTEQVPYGEAATNAPDAPEKDGYVFAGWDPDISAVCIDVTVKPVYHKLCAVNFVDAEGHPICDEQAVEEGKSATPPDMTGQMYEGAPFYAWDGDPSVILDDTTFKAIYKRVPAWTTGSYDPATWTATNNILLRVAIAKNGITYYSETGRTPNDPTTLTDGAVPPKKGDYTGVVGIKSGSIEWTLGDNYYIDRLNIYTIWGDGGRDGIAIDQVLYQTEATSNEWIEAAGPIDGNTVSYGVGDNNTFGALFATLANADGVPFMEKATALKIVFSGAQDNTGTGYVEIEATGKTQAELDGGAMVTFVDYDGTVLKEGMVAYGMAAVPPADPIRDGYKFIGWEGDYSYVVNPVTVTAKYHKWCSVVFKDADGTQIGATQTVEETFAANPPTMTGATYEGKPFLSWDGDPSVITDDVVFTALYGSLPAYIQPFLAEHGSELPAGSLVWAGEKNATWNTDDLCWVKADGLPTRWVDGAVAVLPVAAEIALDGERTVSAILVYGDVVLKGDAITLAAPATITHMEGVTLRFACDVKGEAGIDLENVSRPNYLPQGEANAIPLFIGTTLADIDTSAIKAVLSYSRSGAVAKSVTAGAIDDGVSKTGINYFKSGEGWISFECRAILSEWYNNPYIAKVVLKQVGGDVYGYVEKAEALESISNASSIEVTGGGHRAITIETAEILPVTGAATHRMAVENIILADRDPLWNAATEFAGDYQATGEIKINAGRFRVVGEGTMYGGHCDGNLAVTSPILIADKGIFEFDSTAEQIFATSVNGTSTGGGYADTHKRSDLNGRFVIGPNARSVTLSCTSEGMHRFYSPIDIYGTVTLPKGTYHIVYGNSYGIFVRDGGVLNMNSFLNNYGLRDAIVSCDKGGVINCPDVWSLGSGGSSQPLTLDGGVVHMTKDYTANLGADIKQTALIMKNGALIDGVMMTWGRGANTLTVSGTNACTVALEKIRFGTNKSADSNNMVETMVINDVTGDEAADLTVSSEFYLNGGLSWSLAKASNLGFVKDGVGTMLLTGVSTNFGGSVTMKAGTLALGPKAVLNGAALILTGSATIDLADGAKASFADSSTQTWTDGATLNLTGDISGLSFGPNGLTDAQLAAITINGKASNLRLTSDGHLLKPGLQLIIR